MSPHPHPETFERFDALDAPARLELLRHARGCADCRRRLIADEPSRLFALLAVEPIPTDALDRVSRDVARSVAAVDGGRPARRWYAAASIAASLLLAAYFGLQLWGPGFGTSPDGLAPAELAEIQRILDEHERKHTPVRGIELLSTPGTAQVVDLSLGDTRVVMIFDADLDI